VILPGFDDRNGSKSERLLLTAFTQAGFPHELLAGAELDWRGTGFRAGVDMASRFLPPKNLDNRPRYHVRVRFPHAVRGPIAIGSGRFRGFGLFAAEE
jgi:CRISPR-associated protein Csb2